VHQLVIKVLNSVDQVGFIYKLYFLYFLTIGASLGLLCVKLNVFFVSDLSEHQD